MKAINNKSVRFQDLSTRAKSAIIRIIREELNDGRLKRGESVYNLTGRLRECGFRTRTELIRLAENYKISGDRGRWIFPN